MSRKNHPPERRRPSAARKTRFDHLTDDQIEARWKALLPTFKRTFTFTIAVAAALFCVNHFLQLPQHATDIANVAFQVTGAMAACFAVLLGMGLWMSGGRWRKAPDAGR
jgi:hypothetical protein